MTPPTFWTLYDDLDQKNKLSNLQTARELLYLRAYWDFQFFVRYFFPHYCTWKFSRMHEEFCRDETDPARRSRREVIAAPRGHGKTTLKLTLKVIHAMAYAYESYILIIGQSAPEAEDKVQHILEELHTNKRLTNFYGSLAPQRGAGGKKSFVAANGIKVQAKSPNQQIRGIRKAAHRPSLIICDDVETLEAAQSAEQRSKMRSWFFKDVLHCGKVDGSTNFIFIGTCLHVESLLSELLVNPAWRGRKYQAVETFSERVDLWEEWTRRFTDLSNPNRDKEAEAYFRQHEEAMLAGTRVLWPEGETYLQLMKKLVADGRASFHSEKQNEPLDPDRQIFDMEKARRFEVVQNSNGAFVGLRWLNGSNRAVSAENLERIIAYHDPALGKKPDRKSDVDYAAIAVVARDRDGYLYFLDCYLKRANQSQQIAAAFSLREKWGFDTLYLESNHFQMLMKPVYDDAQARYPQTRPLQVIPIEQHRNKEQRISTLEPDITNGYLLFSNRLDPLIIQQMTLFPTADHDDAPDALQGAVDQLKRLNRAAAWNDLSAPSIDSNDLYAMDPFDHIRSSPY
jgi:predicted phage terminase large subunit-like protein